MAVCHYCAKKPTVGNRVSHSHRKTKRWRYPNVQRVKSVINGLPKHVYACTRCIRSGLVVKSA